MPVYHEVSRAVGEDAQLLRNQAQLFMFAQTSAVSEGRDSVLDEIRDAIDERKAPNWDGHGAARACVDSYITTRNVIRALPSSVPNPEVDVDPDGEISLTWQKSPRRVFSISISGDGVLHYAGLYGYNKMHGSVYFADVIPSEIARLIQRVYL